MFSHDPSVFVDPDVFGEVVTRANTSTFYGILDRQYTDPLDVQSYEPVLIAPETNAIAVGETLVVRGVSYVVQTVETDGQGMVTCRMTKQ
jgi:hypothetical protein